MGTRVAWWRRGRLYNGGCQGHHECHIGVNGITDQYLRVLKRRQTGLGRDDPGWSVGNAWPGRLTDQLARPDHEVIRRLVL